MNTFFTVIIWLDIILASLFILVKFVLPQLLPAIESFLLKTFKKDKGNYEE